MRQALESGEIAAQAFLNKAEAEAAIANLMSGDIRKLEEDWDESYMNEYMKQEVYWSAATKLDGGAPSVTPGAV